MFGAHDDSDYQSLLTYGQRDYLVGKKEFDTKNPKKNENTLRNRLRERIKTGLYDFELLKHLSEKDRDLIFADFDLQRDNKLYRGVTSTLRFVYTGITRDTEADFENLLEEAINQAERLHRDPNTRVMDVDVEIEVETKQFVNTGNARERLDNGEQIDKDELYSLAVSGKLRPEDLEQLEEYETRAVGER